MNQGAAHSPDITSVPELAEYLKFYKFVANIYLLKLSSNWYGLQTFLCSFYSSLILYSSIISGSLYLYLNDAYLILIYTNL